MKARVKWIENNTFLGESNSGHAVVMAASTTPGGVTTAPSPMEYLLLGTGGCTSIDVMMILQKGRNDVRACECRLEAERATTEPKVFTRVAYRYIVRGRNLDRAAVERIVKASAEKYSSATAMLAQTAEILVETEVIDLA